MREAPPDRAAVPHAKVADPARRLGDDGAALGEHGRAFEIGMAGESADHDLPVFTLDGGRAGSPDVNERGRRGQPKRHHRNETLATGDDPGILSVRLEELDRLLPRQRRQVLEWGGDHQPATVRSGWLRLITYRSCP